MHTNVINTPIQLMTHTHTNTYICMYVQNISGYNCWHVKKDTWFSLIPKLTWTNLFGQTANWYMTPLEKRSLFHRHPANKILKWDVGKGFPASSSSSFRSHGNRAMQKTFPRTAPTGDGLRHGLVGGEKTADSRGFCPWSHMIMTLKGDCWSQWGFLVPWIGGRGGR